MLARPFDTQRYELQRFFYLRPVAAHWRRVFTKSLKEVTKSRES
jgi:hypothetical protein